jgi:hypothetical protein
MRCGGGVVGPRPDQRVALGSSPSAGVTDRWATAQCRTVVPLIGGSGLSEVREREPRTGAHVGRSEKEKGGTSPVE